MKKNHKNIADGDKSIKLGADFPKTNTKKMINRGKPDFCFYCIMTS